MYRHLNYVSNCQTNNSNHFTPLISCYVNTTTLIDAQSIFTLWQGNGNHTTAIHSFCCVGGQFYAGMPVTAATPCVIKSLYGPENWKMKLLVALLNEEAVRIYCREY